MPINLKLKALKINIFSYVRNYAQGDSLTLLPYIAIESDKY